MNNVKVIRQASNEFSCISLCDSEDTRLGLYLEIDSLISCETAIIPITEETLDDIEELFYYAKRLFLKRNK